MEKNGFSLIEMLLVLSAVSLLLLLAAPLQMSTLQLQEEEQFIEIFKQDVLLVQNQASVNSKERMYIRFYDDQYRVLHGRRPTFAKRHYPRGWSLISGNNLDLEFKENGTVRNPRTIIMYSEDERILFIFPLGKGRFHIGKEKRVLSH